LFLAGKIESWGRGIDLIRNACLAAAGPAPRFDCDSAGFWAEFPFPALTEGDGTSVKTPVETLVKTRAKTPEKILEMLGAKPDLTLGRVGNVYWQVSVRRRARHCQVGQGRPVEICRPAKGWPLRASQAPVGARRSRRNDRTWVIPQCGTFCFS
jgi:ATP-dependent DNA helicase RecG